MTGGPDDSPPPTRLPTGGVSERFRVATAGVIGDGPVELLPSRLAAAGAAVLGVDGMGLSMMTRQFRIPLGASGAASAHTERIQFTAEQGPCWEAIRADAPLAADAEMIEARWPQFHDDLRARSPFRSAASVPLRLGRRVGGAVDLYFVDPGAATCFDLGAATAIAAHMVDALNRVHDDIGHDAIGLEGPRWALGPAAQGRTAVWVACGILMARSDHTAPDTLALLRAAAYSQGRDLDAIAADLVAGRVDAEHILR